MTNIIATITAMSARARACATVRGELSASWRQVVVRPWQEHRTLAVMAGLERQACQCADFLRTPVVVEDSASAMGERDD